MNITYESTSELRDSENVPQKDDIYQYFLREVKPIFLKPG